MSERISVIIIDDHKLFRDLWSLLFANRAEFELAGTGATVEEAIELVKRTLPDVIYLDINLGLDSGVSLLPVLKSFSPQSRIIVLTMHTQLAYAKKMFKLGASGYVTKNSGSDEVIKSAFEVMKGNTYLCNELKSILSVTKLETPVEDLPRVQDLTLREIEIIKLMKTGLSSKQIATNLALATRTVEVHRHNMFRKLKLKNTAALINFINNTDLNFV